MKLSPFSNLKYSHLKLGTQSLQKYINCIHISISNYNRNMILVSKRMFEVNNNTGHIFKFVSPAPPADILKSKIAAIEPFFYVYLIKTNIECFSFESMMHVIVPKFV